jgi:hypothetical protein
MSQIDEKRLLRIQELIEKVKKQEQEQKQDQKKTQSNLDKYLCVKKND